MVKLIFIMLCLLVVPSAFGQRPNEEYVTNEDIQIRFPGAELPEEDGWYNPSVILPIEYSTEPVATVHRAKAKLGPQYWEFTLQENMITHEKCVIAIDVPSMPVGFRIMELRVRVRVDDGAVVVLGPWSESSSVKIIGKPGNPFLK